MKNGREIFTLFTDAEVFFKNHDLMEGFLFSFAPVTLIKYKATDREKRLANISDDTIRSIVKDAMDDFDAEMRETEYETERYSNYRLRRKPRTYDIDSCFKSDNTKQVFFLLTLMDFEDKDAEHACGNVKEDILGIVDAVMDFPDTALAWKRKMFDAINSLDIDSRDKEYAKAIVCHEFYSNMNLEGLEESEVNFEGNDGFDFDDPFWY